jgi:putative phosphoribosyl transferase
MLFENRKDAGQKLSKSLKKYQRDDLIVFGLARGGIPVAFEVAKEFNKPLDVIIVRKLGLIDQPELGFGAIAPENVMILNSKIVDIYNVTSREIEYVKQKEEEKILKRMLQYRKNKIDYDLENKVALLIDDGIATGITTLVAIKYIKKFNPKRIIVASPICASGAIEAIKSETDDFICQYSSNNFSGISEFYKEFAQISDEEVVAMLNTSKKFSK